MLFQMPLLLGDASCGLICNAQNREGNISGEMKALPNKVVKIVESGEVEPSRSMRQIKSIELFLIVEKNS